MTVNLNIQADVIDIRVDTPQQDDIFLVDTNVWFWQTYTNAGFGTNASRFSNYLNYLNRALSRGATLTYSGLTLAELAHIIEKTEYEIYIQSYGRVPIKEYLEPPHVRQPGDSCLPKKGDNGTFKYPSRRLKQLPVPKVLQLRLLFNCFCFRSPSQCQLGTLNILPLFAL